MCILRQRKVCYDALCIDFRLRYTKVFSEFALLPYSLHWKKLRVLFANGVENRVLSSKKYRNIVALDVSIARSWSIGLSFYSRFLVVYRKTDETLSCLNGKGYV